MEPVKWTSAIQDILHDVQTQALDTLVHFPNADKGAQQSMVPQATRLLRIYDDEVLIKSKKQKKSEADIREECYVIFLNTLWEGLALVLTADGAKVPPLVVESMGSLLAAFFLKMQSGPNRRRSSMNPDDKIEPDKNKRDESLASLRSDLLDHLMNASQATDKTVRLRSTQILRYIVCQGPVFQQSTRQALQQALLKRANDKLASVRAEAATGLGPLEQEEKEEDSVRDELLYLLQCDQAKEVRKAVVKSMRSLGKNLSSLLPCTRDVSEEVRKAAYKRLGQSVHVDDLCPSDRLQLLTQGFHDDSTRVQCACEDMLLFTWLVSKNRSFISLVETLDLPNHPTIGRDVCYLLFDQYVGDARDDNPLVQIRKSYGFRLDPSTIFLWSLDCQYTSQVVHDADKASELLPTAFEFAEQLTHLHSTQSIDSIRQLLLLGLQVDFQEGHGRKKLLQAIRKILVDRHTSTSLFPSLLDLLACIHSPHDERTFIRLISNIISETFNPLELDQDVQEIDESKLDDMYTRLEQLNTKRSRLDVDTTEHEMEQEARQLQSDIHNATRTSRHTRALHIAKCLLERTTRSLKDYTLQGLERLILPALKAEKNSDLYRQAVLCLVPYCLKDAAEAQEHLPLFLHLSASCADLELRQTSLQAVFDLLRVVEPPEEVLENLRSDMMHETDMRRLSVMVDGFLRLYLNDQIVTSSILSTLLHLLFQPYDRHTSPLEEDYGAKCRQLLRTYIPVYVASSTRHCHLFHEAAERQILSTIESIDVDDRNLSLHVRALASFTLHVLRHPEANQDMSCCHLNHLATTFCIELLALGKLHDRPDKGGKEEKAIANRMDLCFKILSACEPSMQDKDSYDLCIYLVHVVQSTCLDSTKKKTQTLLQHFKPPSETYQVDQDWVTTQVQDRFQALEPFVLEIQKEDERHREAALKKRKRETDESDSEEELGDELPVAPRTKSSRQSKQQAQTRMAAQEIRAKEMIQATQESDEDEQESESESEEDISASEEE